LTFIVIHDIDGFGSFVKCSTIWIFLMVSSWFHSGKTFLGKKTSTVVHILVVSHQESHDVRFPLLWMLNLIKKSVLKIRVWITKKQILRFPIEMILLPHPSVVCVGDGNTNVTE
jgi:hypothetical protein